MNQVEQWWIWKCEEGERANYSEWIPNLGSVFVTTPVTTAREPGADTGAFQPELQSRGGAAAGVAQATCLCRAATNRAEQESAFDNFGTPVPTPHFLPSARLVGGR